VRSALTLFTSAFLLYAHFRKSQEKFSESRLLFGRLLGRLFVTRALQNESFCSAPFHK
jgi:hypothetical protein